MKKPGVAIVGAGIAGLSCALTLEREGITPVIYDQGYQKGARFNHISILPTFAYRGNSFSIEKLGQNYGINLTPYGKLKKIILKGHSNETVIKGDNLGTCLN